MLPGPLPTPVLAFAVRELGAVAGVQITASHNPPADNGYKVYLADGAQLVPPADARDRGGDRRRAARGLRPGRPAAPVIDDVREAYLRPGRARCRAARPRTLRIALTPLHGVGGETARARAARAPGSPTCTWSPTQAAPDPDFPTVAFPNPEEPGAADALLATGRARSAPTWPSRWTRTPTAARSACPTAGRAGGC